MESVCVFSPIICGTSKILLFEYLHICVCVTVQMRHLFLNLLQTPLLVSNQLSGSSIGG